MRRRVQRSTPIALTLVGCLLVAAGPAFGWGAKGHMMAGRVAVRNLPNDVPLFFRSATERLAYLIPEPDRWRGEAWRDEVTMHKVGMAFYAIIEEMQRLTVQFRLWREAHEAAVIEPAAIQQIQENAIFTAGILGHWITDSAQPLYTTVHSDDWDPRFPNPNKYVTQRIHGRFESAYVDRAIRESDIHAKMTPARALADWRAGAEAHIRRSFSHVEEVYALDRRGSFGSGKEPAEAHGFTAARLAEGASMLRDAWYSAWTESLKELWDTPVRLPGSNGRSALDLLRESKVVELRGTGSGQTVTAIGERREGIDGRKWKLYSGGMLVEEPARHITSDDELLQWRFTR